MSETAWIRRRRDPVSARRSASAQTLASAIIGKPTSTCGFTVAAMPRHSPAVKLRATLVIERFDARATLPTSGSSIKCSRSKLTNGPRPRYSVPHSAEPSGAALGLTRFSQRQLMARIAASTIRSANRPPMSVYPLRRPISAYARYDPGRLKSNTSRYGTKSRRSTRNAMYIRPGESCSNFHVSE